MENSAEYQHSDDAVMGKWVYIEKGIVVDRTQIDPFKVFEPSYAEKFIEAPLEVDHFWRYEDGEFLPPEEVALPEITPAPSQEDLLKTINDLQARLAALETK